MNLQVAARSDLYSGLVEISVKNTGTSKCHTRYPLHSNGLLKENAVNVEDTNQHRAPYMGPVLLNDGHQTTLLDPNQELSFIVNLSQSYALEEDTEYFASYATYCEENPHEVAISNKVSVPTPAIAHDADPKKILADRMKNGFEGYTYLSSGVDASRYKFLNTNDQVLIEETAKAADHAFENLKNITTFDQAKFRKYYNQFICDENSNTKTKFESSVQSTFSKTLKFMEGNDIAFIYRGKYCDPDTNAYVYPAEPLKNIYICDRFAAKLPTLPQTNSPYYTKLGTITHEITHKVNPCVVDYYYPVEDCVDHVKRFNCVDTQVIVDTLGGSCDEKDIEYHLLNQRPLKTKEDVNLNMYTANCLRFFSEAAYQPQPTSDDMTKTYMAVGTAALVAFGYFSYRRLGHHPHAN